AERKSERVPVQKLVMKKQEVTVMRPQTAYRTVPIGTSMAYGPFIGGTQMAYGYPIIDSTATRSALAPQPDPISSERSTFKADDDDKDSNFRRSDASGTDGIRGSSFENRTPLRSDDEPSFPPSTGRKADKPDNLVMPAVYSKERSLSTAE